MSENKIVLTDEELDQINGGIQIIKTVKGIPVSLGVASATGKDDPGKNKIFGANNG